MPGEFEFGQQQEISEREDRTYARPVGAVYPTFFVGVGGCGSEIVQRIYNLLSSRSDFKDRYEKLIQFVAIDTDMDDLNQLSLKYKFLISDFPKGEYIKVKTGKEYKDPDPFFMQWWPTWYAGRPDSTKGAGQIRVESRLSLYYQLDADRGGLIEQFNDAIVRSKDHDNPYRVVRPPLAYCHIFGSVAGGTGSGGILTLAYLFRELLENHKLSPVMVGHLLLPTLFYRKVRSRLHSDIRSNGYATLKELEWFMTLGYNNNPRQMRGDIERPEEDGIEFNFNPNNKPEKGNTRVTVPPFHLVNIIDEPGDFSFAEPRHIYPAIAGTAYVQLFSPIIGQRESEEDNYYKKIKHLDSNGAFSLNYGTYGLSMLVLPDRDILDYCESRMMKGLLEELCGGDTEGSDTVFFERFKALVQRQVQACKDDPTGVRTIAALRMALEAGIMDLCFPEGEERKTIAKGWQEALDPSRCGLFHLLQELLQAREKGVDRAVDQLPDTLELTEEVLPSTATGNKGELEKHIESLSRKLQSTISDYQDSVSKKGQLAPEEIQKVVADFLASGMDGRQPGPLSVRLALIAFRRLLQQRTDDLDVRSSGKAVPTTTALQNALDELLFRWKFTGLDAARAAPLVGRFVPGDDDWKNCRKQRFPELWSEDIQAARRIIRSDCRANLYSTAIRWVDGESKKLKELNHVLLKIVEGLDHRVARALEPKEGMSNEFILDDEVLTGVRTRIRHWARLFDWLVKVKVPQISDATIDIGLESVATDSGDKIQAKLSTAMALLEELGDCVRSIEKELNLGMKAGEKKRRPSEAKLKAELEEVARRFCRKRLVGLILGKRQAGDERATKGLMIDECLELEARWELEELYVRDHLANFQQSIHGGISLMTKEEIAALRQELLNTFEPTEQDLRAYIEEKISFVADKSRCFSKLRLTETNCVDPFSFICLHKGHYADERGLFRKGDGQGEPLTRFITENRRFRTARVLDGWTDEKRIAFFNAMAGLPVHNFLPVNTELKAAYEHIYREYVTGTDPKKPPIKDFPSHVDKNFEDPCNWDPHAILPDLEPGRSIRKREKGVKHFMELVAYELVIPVDAASWEKKWKDGKGAVASQKEAEDSDHIKKEDRESRLAGEEGWDSWIIDAEALPTPKGADPVVSPGRAAFVEVLGDRVNRAFDRYQNTFCPCKAKKAKVDHIQELLDNRKQKERLAENPKEFKDGLKDLIVRFRKIQEELAAKLEDGHRVRPYADFIHEALASLVEIYKEYKDSGGGV